MKERLLLAAWLLWVPAHAAEPLPEPLTLGAALAVADEAHPEIAEAQAALAAARATREQAASDYRPSLSLDARWRYLDAYDRSGDASTDDSYAQLVLGQTLYDFGRTDAAVAAGQARVDSRNHLLLDSRQQRRLEVMRRFFDVLLADLAHAEANEAMSVAYVRMDKAGDRHELGQISDIALLDSERSYQESRLAFYQQQTEQRLSRTRLAMALNRPDELSAKLVRPALEPRERPPLEELTREILASAPEIASLRADQATAEAALEAARSDRWPVVRGEVAGAVHHREIGGRSGPLSASLILEMPLFDGGARSARIAELNAELNARRARLQQAELAVREQVTELWLQLELLRVRSEQLAVLADYQELYLDRSRALYELEVTTDLGDSMTKTTEVRLQQAETEFELAMTWARIDALRGQLVATPAPAPENTP